MNKEKKTQGKVNAYIGSFSKEQVRVIYENQPLVEFMANCQMHFSPNVLKLLQESDPNKEDEEDKDEELQIWEWEGGAL